MHVPVVSLLFEQVFKSCRSLLITPKFRSGELKHHVALQDQDWTPLD